MIKNQIKMSKAEDRALEKYPIEMYKELGWSCVDKNAYKRQYFIEGYQQAEKDLALTWEDIKTIDKLLNQCVDYSNPYQEVLKRFKDFKERKEEP